MGTHSCGHTSSHKKKCRTQAIQSSGKGRRSPSHDVPAHAPPRLCPHQCRVCPVSGWLRAFEHVATVVRETAAVKDGSRARAWGIRGQARTQQLRPSGDEKKNRVSNTTADSAYKTFPRCRSCKGAPTISGSTTANEQKTNIRSRFPRLAGQQPSAQLPSAR